MPGDMNQKFIADPLNFMDKYAVQATDNIGGEVGTKLHDLDSGDSLGTDYALNDMPTNRIVAHINLDKMPRGAGLASSAGLVKVTGSFTQTPTTIDSYFLPWRDNKIVRLKIPALGTALVTDHVKYFFTAAISGCSIFVKGTPRSPEIFHAGGNTGQSDPLMAAQFWRLLMRQHAVSSSPSYAEVNKNNYVSDTGAVAGVKSTAHSRQFEDWLKDNKPKDLDIESVVPTGCVMGIRDLQGNWSFYLQENVTIYHQKFKKIGLIQTKKVVKGSLTTSCRPMIVRRFFPGGIGHADFTPRMPRTL